MKKIQNIALIALLAIIMVPQNLFCPEGMVDMFNEGGESKIQDNTFQDPAEKTLLERIKEAARNRFNNARDFVSKKFGKSDQPSTEPTPSASSRPRSEATSSSAFEDDGFGTRFSPETSSGVKIKLDEKSPEPSPTVKEYNPLARFEGKGRWSNGFLEGLKSDYRLLQEFLQDPNERNEKLEDVEILRKGMSKLTRQERADLLTEITVNEIKANPSKVAENIWAKNIKEFNNILPETDLVILLHDGKEIQGGAKGRRDMLRSYRFDIIDMSKYDTNLSPEKNYNRMKKDLGSNISLKDFQIDINSYANEHSDFNEKFKKNVNSSDIINPNEVPSLDPNATIKTRANYAINHKDQLNSDLNDLFYQNRNNQHANLISVLKEVMEKLPADQKAAALTEIVREQFERTAPKPKNINEFFDQQISKINEILPSTDLLMSTFSSNDNNPNSFRFQIADMSKFEYDSNASPEENAARLAKSQNLQIRTADLVDSMLDYYWNNNRMVHDEIIMQEIESIGQNMKLTTRQKYLESFKIIQKDLQRRFPPQDLSKLQSEIDKNADVLARKMLTDFSFTKENLINALYKAAHDIQTGK